jgi:hypothetical protein
MPIRPSIRAALALLLLLLAPRVYAQEAEVSPATRLARAEADVRAVDRALDLRVDDDARGALRERIIAARVAATAATADLADQLALVDARLAGLGPAGGAEASASNCRGSIWYSIRA